MWFITEPPKNPLIEIAIEPIIIQEVVAPEPTVEEKIKLNYYNCNEAVEWIRADTAQCLPKAVVTARTTENPSQPIKNASDGTNTYSPGYCTWYTKNTLSWVPNGWGNANMWASNARSQGYTVSTTPAVGSVAQTSSGSLGHVAVVTRIDGNSVTISEMNYTGKYVVSSRTVPISDFIYIY